MAKNRTNSHDSGVKIIEDRINGDWLDGDSYGRINLVAPQLQCQEVLLEDVTRARKITSAVGTKI